MARILAIGIATLDIVNLVPSYPAEDSEVRALEQRVSRGGNATNTLVVLSQLGHHCSWGGVLAEDSALSPILADLDRYRVDLQYCRRLAAGRNPTSYILLSQATGSRSIVHYRDLPEYTGEDFRAVDLTGFDWLHFEGRNVEATGRMLDDTRRRAPALPLSLEVEKPRTGIERLFGYPDLLLFSRSFAESAGYEDPEPFLLAMCRQAPQADLVCAWGAHGAFALSRDGGMHASPAFPPPALVDTLGAGDTFNAGVIDALLRAQDLSAALVSGCRLAGHKCGRPGFDGLAGWHG